MFKLKDFAQDISVAIKDAQSSPFDRFVGLEHYDSGEPVITRYTDKSLLSSSVKEFRKNDILIARRNVYLKRAGIAFFDGLTSGDSIVLRIYDDCESRTGISKQDAIRIIPFILNSNVFWAYANKHADGMNSKRISKEMLYDYEFDLPPLAEQKVLAEKLWAAYRLKESYKKLLAATEEMVKSQFIEMFGDPLKNPKNYTQRKLGDVATLLNGRAYKASELLSSGRYLVLRVGNFFTNTDYYYSDLELEPDKYCDTGDILYSWSATLGAQIWKGGKVIYHYHIWKVLFDENILNKEYFCFMLNVMTDSLKQETHGSTMVHLTKDGMEKKFIAIPPLELQRRFVSIAEQADKSGFELRKSIDAIDVVIKSLINS